MSDSYNNDDEVNMAEDDEYVYLNRCASERLFILRDQSCLESFVYSEGPFQTTRAGVQLYCLWAGKFRDWLDLCICNDAVKKSVFVKHVYFQHSCRYRHVVCSCKAGPYDGEDMRIMIIIDLQQVYST